MAILVIIRRFTILSLLELCDNYCDNRLKLLVAIMINGYRYDNGKI